MEGWHRLGGSRLQFYATVAEIAEWLQETLPSDFAPYTILGHDWRDRRWEPFEYSLSRIEECFARRSNNLWLRSDVLSPGLGGDETQLSFAGLILVQLGRERHDLLEEASIAVVDRIRHESGAERHNAEYRRLFDRLRRSLRKRIVVETARTLADGTVVADARMTARAADAHVRGEVRFAAEPVGLRP